MAAHPDDEVLGCGATIAKKAALGYEITLLILGEGATSRYKERDVKQSSTEIRNLRKNVLASAKILGIKSVEFGELPDNRFDSLDILDITKVVEGVKKKVSPDVIYTHHSADLNRDHQLTFRAVLTAFRPQPHEKNVSIYCFEVASSTEWQMPNSDNIFKPQLFEDVEGYIKTKIMAMEIYKSELRDYPHPRSLEAIKTYAQYRGITIGRKFAEAFEVVREMR